MTYDISKWNCAIQVYFLCVVPLPRRTILLSGVECRVSDRAGVCNVMLRLYFTCMGTSTMQRNVHPLHCATNISPYLSMRWVHLGPVNNKSTLFQVFGQQTLTTGSYSDSKVYGTNMGPSWGRQVPGGPHVGPTNFAIWVYSKPHSVCYSKTLYYSTACTVCNSLFISNVLRA